MTDAPTLELLDWVSIRPRTYPETMEAWQSHCPRLLIWEDALLEGCKLTFSVGIAAHRPGQSAASAGALLAEADHALFEAKRQGRDRASVARVKTNFLS